MYTILKVGLVALVGFGLAVTLNAFTSETKRVNHYWQYNPGSVTDIRDGSQYTELTTPPNESPCEEGDDLPCVLQTGESVASQSALTTYLNNGAMFPTDASIINSAIYKKEAD